MPRHRAPRVHAPRAASRNRARRRCRALAGATARDARSGRHERRAVRRLPRLDRDAAVQRLGQDDVEQLVVPAVRVRGRVVLSPPPPIYSSDMFSSVLFCLSCLSFFLSFSQTTRQYRRHSCNSPPLRVPVLCHARFSSGRFSSVIGSRFSNCLEPDELHTWHRSHVRTPA